MHWSQHAAFNGKIQLWDNSLYNNIQATPTYGTVNKLQCVVCATDTYSDAGTGNLKCCPTGSYAGVGRLVCCPTNTYAPKDSTICTYFPPCAAGTYRTPDRTGKCEKCVQGKYSQEENAMSVSTCLQCPTNTNSPEASNHLSNCVCDAGFTRPNGGPCEQCTVGKYKSILGNVVCTDCPLNANSNEQKTSCICDSGYSGLNLGPCTKCAVEIGKISDCDCSPGSFSVDNTISSYVVSSSLSESSRHAGTYNYVGILNGLPYYKT